MKITIITRRFGSQVIDTETFIPERAAASSTIFKCFEFIFDNWYEAATAPGVGMGKDIEGMYCGEGDQPAIYSRRGAIIEAMEILIEDAQENSKSLYTSRDLQKLDVEGCFL